MLSSRVIVLRGLVDAAAAATSASAGPATMVKKREFHRSAAVSKPAKGSGDVEITEQERNLFIDNLGRLRREVPSSYTHVDTFTYKLAVEEDPSCMEQDECDVQRERLSRLEGTNAEEEEKALPLFGTIPALRAVGTVLEEELNVSMDKLRLAEHYFHSFKPMPTAAAGMRSIVDLTDIVHRFLGSMIIFDVATLDSDDTFYSYNQFCYQLRGVNSFGSSIGSRRYIPTPNHSLLEESFPQVDRVVAVSERQECLLSRLMPDACSESDIESTHVHPLTSVGVLAKSLLDRAGIPAERFQSVKVCFPNAMHAGHPVRLSAWRRCHNKILFHTSCAVRGEQPHYGGIIRLSGGNNASNKKNRRRNN